MDHSSFTEAQQQQQYQEHQQAELAQQHQQQLQLYQQHQNQDYYSQPYDPSQVQAYDQSAQAYDQSAQAYNQSAQAYNQSAQAYNQSAQAYNQPAQAYNQSAQAYYPYYQYQQPQQSQQHQQQQQQQYQYYQPEYGNVYQQPAHQQQPQQELGPVQPPGVPVSHEAPPPQSVEGGGAGSGHGQLHVQHQQNAYYPQGGGEQQSSGFPLLPGLNPAAAAAVAALSQLTQFAGTMDAAERAMAGLHGRQWHGKGGGYRPMMGPGHGPGAFHGHEPMHHGRGPMRPPAGRSPYRGGGRRGGGGGPFRGGGRGNFGPRHPFRGGGSGLPFRGRSRGRGRGGSRRFAPYATSSSSHPESAAVEDAELPEEEGEPSGVLSEEASEAVVLAETSPSMVAPGDSAPNWQPSQVAWCELCRVDCTSLEILEQHKNGKRHKKNLQRIEELKSGNLTGTEILNDPEGESKFQTEIAQEGEEESDDEGEENPEKNLPSEAIADENKVVSEQKNDIVEQPEKPMEERSDSQVGKPRMEHFDNWRRGMKRRMRGGRGGKRMKMFEAPRRSIEPPKPKVVIPLICDLCNVKCDTQEVFDRHLSGKKHIAKLKRFEGHQALYGPMGLQALYPPNPIAQTLLHPQGHQQQGYYSPPGSFPPQGPYMPPQAHQAAPPAAGAVTQFQQNAITQGSEAHPRSGSQAVVSVVHEPQQQFARVESGNKESVTAEMNHANGISESGSNGPNPPQDNTLTRVEHVYAATHEAAPLPDCGVTADHVSVPGLDIQPKEGASE